MYIHACSMAKKRTDRSGSGPTSSNNPFADALANALGVDAPTFSERVAWDEDDPLHEGNGSKWVHMAFEKKGRGGKTVTVLNFQNPGIDPVEWSKKLKARLGVGGSVDEASILLQGDVRTKLESYLQTEGFSVKRIGG